MAAPDEGIAVAPPPPARPDARVRPPPAGGRAGRALVKMRSRARWCGGALRAALPCRSRARRWAIVRALPRYAVASSSGLRACIVSAHAPRPPMPCRTGPAPVQAPLTLGQWRGRLRRDLPDAAPGPPVTSQRRASGSGARKAAPGGGGSLSPSRSPIVHLTFGSTFFYGTLSGEDRAPQECDPSAPGRRPIRQRGVVADGLRRAGKRAGCTLPA